MLFLNASHVFRCHNCTQATGRAQVHVDSERNNRQADPQTTGEKIPRPAEETGHWTLTQDGEHAHAMMEMATRTESKRIGPYFYNGQGKLRASPLALA